MVREIKPLHRRALRAEALAALAGTATLRSPDTPTRCSAGTRLRLGDLREGAIRAQRVSAERSNGVSGERSVAVPTTRSVVRPTSTHAYIPTMTRIRVE